MKVQRQRLQSFSLPSKPISRAESFRLSYYKEIILKQILSAKKCSCGVVQLTRLILDQKTVGAKPTRNATLMSESAK